MTLPTDGYVWCCVMDGVGIVDAFGDEQSAVNNADKIVKQHGSDVWVGQLTRMFSRNAPTVTETEYDA